MSFHVNWNAGDLGLRRKKKPLSNLNHMTWARPFLDDDSNLHPPCTVVRKCLHICLCPFLCWVLRLRCYNLRFPAWGSKFRVQDLGRSGLRRDLELKVCASLLLFRIICVSSRCFLTLAGEFYLTPMLCDTSASLLLPHPGQEPIIYPSKVHRQYYPTPYLPETSGTVAPFQHINPQK